MMVYVYLAPSGTKATRTEVVKDGSLMLDYDERGEIIGVEIMDALRVTVDDEDAADRVALATAETQYAGRDFREIGIPL